MRSANILIIEDQKPDVDYMVYTLQKNHVKNQLSIIYDGNDALEYVKSVQEDIPDLVFLDLNIPRIHGIEVLKSFKQSPSLKEVPVIILTSHITMKKRKEVMENGAFTIIEKPVSYEHLIESLTSIDNIALSIVTTETD